MIKGGKKMKTFDYTIKDALGIHARPAGLLVKEVGKYQSKISLTKDGKTVDAARLMAVMSLGVKQGQTITVTAEGDDEEAAASEIQAFFEANL